MSVFAVFAQHLAIYSTLLYLRKSFYLQTYTPTSRHTRLADNVIFGGELIVSQLSVSIDLETVTGVFSLYLVISHIMDTTRLHDSINFIISLVYRPVDGWKSPMFRKHLKTLLFRREYEHCDG